MRKHLTLLLLLSQVFFSCEDLDIDILYPNPKKTKPKNSELDLTYRNIEKILQQSAGDTIRLIMMGDSYLVYDEAQDFVKAANKLKR